MIYFQRTCHFISHSKRTKARAQEFCEEIVKNSKLYEYSNDDEFKEIKKLTFQNINETQDLYIGLIKPNKTKNTGKNILMIRFCNFNDYFFLIY